ncbi:MAG: TetR/AcrR family transcriptional regulator [Deltaproteobacteria bacterium]|nr:TetR/AcrR family transcriptional regulator [Deltaproteobacteria bacterium]
MMKTRKNNPEYKRAQVLEAAKDLFIDQGYHSTSMSQIARRSGVTQSMIHYYYESKKRLFEAVIADSLEPLYRQRLLPKGAERNLRELLRASMIQRFRFFQENPQVAKLFTRTLLMEEFQPDELSKMIGGKWIEIYRQAQKEGLIHSKISPENIMIIYLALTTYWFLDNIGREAMGSRKGYSREKADNEYLEAILTMFVESLQVNEPSREDRD